MFYTQIVIALNNLAVEGLKCHDYWFNCVLLLLSL